MLGPYAKMKLYVDPDSNAARQAIAWKTSDPTGAALMAALAQRPQSVWLSREWAADARRIVDATLVRAAGALCVFVVYDIPNRDGDNHSSGGAKDAATYRSYVADVAAGLAGRGAIVVLEPDGTSMDEFDDERAGLISDAADVLTRAGGRVYIDAGSNNWIPAEEISRRLRLSGIHRAAGFALNTSGTQWTEEELDYGQQIRGILGERARFVIDVSRNGLGPDPSPENEERAWCDAKGRGLGRAPTLRIPKLAPLGCDALLAVKRVGESDGCDARAGTWLPLAARELCERAVPRLIRA